MEKASSKIEKDLGKISLSDPNNKNFSAVQNLNVELKGKLAGVREGRKAEKEAIQKIRKEQKRNFDRSKVIAGRYGKGPGML